MVAPLVTVPVFNAGTSPTSTDMNNLLYNNFLFLSTRVVLRVRQAQGAQSVPPSGTTLIRYDTVDEDPYGGWNFGGFYWQPPAGINGWFQVTLTITTAGVVTGNAWRPVLSGTYGNHLATVPTAVVHSGGTVGSWTVFVTGGVTQIQGAVQLLNASQTISTQNGAGQECAMDIVWLSL